jgi:plastocyanin
MRASLLLTLCVVAAAVACRKPPTEDVRGHADVSAQAQLIDPATAAQIAGTVYFSGPAPRPVLIDMSADNGCRGVTYSESLVVNEGKLQNVFVYLDGGFTFSPSRDPVLVEQRSCRYVPHVVAAAVTQPIEFRNIDPTIHNIHGAPRENDAWNVSQPAQAPPMVRTFPHAESMIPVKCNQHPWMKMYINVSASPFFAVTDAQGRFALSGIPPGTYDLVFVHETLGEQRHSVTIGAKEQKTIDVSYAR